MALPSQETDIRPVIQEKALHLKFWLELGTVLFLSFSKAGSRPKLVIKDTQSRKQHKEGTDYTLSFKYDKNMRKGTKFRTLTGIVTAIVVSVLIFDTVFADTLLDSNDTESSAEELLQAPVEALTESSVEAPVEDMVDEDPGISRTVIDIPDIEYNTYGMKTAR